MKNSKEWGFKVNITQPAVLYVDNKELIVSFGPCWIILFVFVKRDLDKIHLKEGI